ncbi:MAG: hypothetical protein AAF988_03830 [Pseudomonadota bacterium]
MGIRSDLLKRQSERSIKLRLSYTEAALEEAGIDKSLAPALLRAFDESRYLIQPSLNDQAKHEAGFVTGTFLTADEVKDIENETGRKILDFLYKEPIAPPVSHVSSNICKL